MFVIQYKLNILFTSVLTCVKAACVIYAKLICEIFILVLHTSGLNDPCDGCCLSMIIIMYRMIEGLIFKQ